MREIGAKTSFARSSIYNYFQTKEEFQLGLTIREFTAWKDALQKILENENKNILQFAEAIAAFLADRNQFIKLIWLCEKISVNSTTVIKNDIVERLEKQPLNFFTVYNKYRNLSSFSNIQSAGVERSGMEAD